MYAYGFTVLHHTRHVQIQKQASLGDTTYCTVVFFAHRGSGFPQIDSSEKSSRKNSPPHRNLLGGYDIPLKNMSSSIGMMTFPIYGNIIQSCSSHHQPVMLFHYFIQSPQHLANPPKKPRSPPHLAAWVGLAHLRALRFYAARRLRQVVQLDPGVRHGHFHALLRLKSLVEAGYGKTREVQQSHWERHGNTGFNW